MIEIRYVKKEDKTIWYQFDKHLPEEGFDAKVDLQQGYILWDNDVPVGILRYNLFWDNIPFCTMLFISHEHQKRSYGKQLMAHWEADMKSKGYDMVLTSTQVDEAAQHFYRKLGYQDCGGLVMDVPGHEQPMELFLVKQI